MRLIQSLILAAALQAPAVVSAQQVSIGGWVNHVDAANSTLTLRTLANPRTVQIAPNAVIRVNGVVTRLEQLPANSAVTITAEKGPNGVLTATQVSAQSNGPRLSAAAPPGSIVRGTLVGLNIPENTITLRTVSGDHVFPLGTAPIVVNGVRGSIRNLRAGETIQLQRALPTDASTDYITQALWVLPATNGMAGSNPRTMSRPVIRSRVSGYRATSRSIARAHAARSRHRTRRARRRARSRVQKQARRINIGVQSAAALAGTAPLMAATAPGPEAVYVAPSVVSTGPGYVAPSAYVPGWAYFVSGVTNTSAPLTPALTNQAPNGTTATGPADVRNQSAVINSGAATAIANPRNQSIFPTGAVGPGVIPAPGIPDPRFQSIGPGVPGVSMPIAPGPVGNPGFVGPRPLGPPFRGAPRR